MMTVPDRPTPPRPSSVKDGDLLTPMELRDYLEGVGAIMGLPAKTTVSMTAVREQRPVAERRRRGPLVLPIVALISLGAWAAVSLRPAPVAELPLDLRGTWVTDDPRYAGRSLVLGRTEVVVVHPAGQEVSVVRAVQVRRGLDTLGVVVSTGDAPGREELSLAFVGGASEHLVLRNPEAVRWVRRAQVPTLPSAPAAASPPKEGGSAPR